jgi:hypothetical protein
MSVSIHPDASYARFVSALDSSGTRVASYVLDSHAAVIRILNPASDAHGEPTSWRDASSATGNLTSTTRWSAISGLAPSGFDGPDTGTVAAGVADVVLRALAGCLREGLIVAQWEGYVDVDRPANAPLVTFPPGRSCFVWRTTVSQLAERERIPMRWWDSALSWTLGNDIYASSVFLSGSERLISAVLDSPSVEAFRVSFDDPVVAEDM